jgi:hypothetical protein
MAVGKEAQVAQAFELNVVQTAEARNAAAAEDTPE